MKRHDALIPLSHDHQHALASALRLRRARDLASDERRAELDRFLHFAEQQLEPHFQQEEAVMAQVARTHDLPLLVEAGARLLDEHARLRKRFDVLRRTSGAPDPALLHETGVMLTDHIRFEERDLFELLQRELGDDLVGVVDDASAG
jgi:hemerythrin-like domain-containing protein